MKTQNYIFAALMMVLTFGCASSINPHMNTFNANSNGWKPADFNPENGILLVQKLERPKRQQAKMEEIMAKNYKYKYEFVDLKDLQSNSKYADKNIYRFALVYSIERHERSEMTKDGFRNSTIITFDFNFLDRLNDKAYPKSGIPSSWASMTFEKIIQACVKN